LQYMSGAIRDENLVFLKGDVMVRGVPTIQHVATGHEFGAGADVMEVDPWPEVRIPDRDGDPATADVIVLCEPATETPTQRTRRKGRHRAESRAVRCLCEGNAACQCRAAMLDSARSWWARGAHGACHDRPLSAASSSVTVQTYSAGVPSLLTCVRAE